jgi:3-methyladenine DNA glycosylase AlkD
MEAKVTTALDERVALLLTRLVSMADADKLAQEARLGIKTEGGLGISIWELRKIAKEIGTDQALAEALWGTGVREARLLAGYLADPAAISEATIERWVADFDSWDLVDQVSDVFLFSPYAKQKIVEWSERPEEFVKRSAFAMIAGLAVYDKAASDRDFLAYLPIIQQAAADERNYVKKAVNWALRNIGKRNLALNAAAIKLAQALTEQESKVAQWIGRDALKELQSAEVQERLRRGNS